MMNKKFVHFAILSLFLLFSCNNNDSKPGSKLKPQLDKVLDKNAPKAHVVFMVGESNHYGSRSTMKDLAHQLEKHHHCRVTYIDNEISEPAVGFAPIDGKKLNRSLKGVAKLRTADLLIMFMRFRMPGKEELKELEHYFDSGKPAIAFRDTSHLFWKQNKGWFVPRFGGHYKG